MRELLPHIETWAADHKRIALATLVRVYGASPRPLGAKMVISSEGEIAGSVSGGCVESAVVDESKQVLLTGRPKLLHFGIADETAWSVGLSCGGKIEVFLESLDPASLIYSSLKESLEAGHPTVRCVVLSGAGIGAAMLFEEDGKTRGGLGSRDLEELVQKHAGQQLELGRNNRQSLSVSNSTFEVFFEVFPPPEKLIVVGAVHVAIYLVQFAKILGFRTIVVDPRSTFATEERFPAVDELHVQWPAAAIQQPDLDESTYVAVLSHDERLDNPFLEMAVSSRCRYIGALGSRKTHARRTKALIEMGVSEDKLSRIRSPIGLDLGGSQPAEIALSIISEIVSVRNSME